MYEKEKLNKLEGILRDMGSIVVGFSGGVDSTFLLKVAKGALGDRVMAVTASSSAFPVREIEDAIAFARDIKARHRMLELKDIETASFSHNPEDRCYHCKKEIFTQILHIAAKEGIQFVVDGTNADDTGDYRPGMKAAREIGIRSPLMEAGLTKNDIRALSRELGLSTWDKPSCACLMSRIPYGQEITTKKLRMIGLGEQYLMDQGFKQVRVRHHGDVARIEVSKDEMGKFLDAEFMSKVADKFKEFGFNFTALDLRGYRTGSLNETIDRE